VRHFAWILFFVIAFVLPSPKAQAALSAEQEAMVPLIERKNIIEADLRKKFALKRMTAADVPAELTRINRQIADLAHTELINQGYTVGAVTPVSGRSHVFRIEMRAGPNKTPVASSIAALRKNYDMGVIMQVGDMHFGQYIDELNDICVAPQALFLPKGEIYNTILHEPRHGFFYSKLKPDYRTHMAEVDKALHLTQRARDPLNVSVYSLGSSPVTDDDIYRYYINFQEVTTHERDFHYARSGVPSTYELENMTPADVAIMKAKKSVHFSDRLGFFSDMGIQALKDPSTKFTTGVSDAGNFFIEIPVKDPKTHTPGWRVKVYLPGLSEDTSKQALREAGVELLEHSRDIAPVYKARVEKDLAAFKANPVTTKFSDSRHIERMECEGLYRFLGH
jgi:hypothetical protein